MLNSYFHDRLILVSALTGLGINIILWVMLAGKYGLATEQVPLHFSVIFGIDFVGQARQIYLLPASGLLVLLLNVFLGHVVSGREKLYGYFLNLGALAVQAVLLIAGIALTSLTHG
jgi:hypothetical protein